MKRGDYSTQAHAHKYYTKRFSRGLEQVALDEANILRTWIKQLPSDFTHLDLGTGTGRVVNEVLKINPKKIIASDASEAMLGYLSNLYSSEIKKGKIEIKQFKSDGINLKRHSVQLVTAFHLFKHLESVDSTIKSSSNVLDTGGYLIFDILNENSLVTLNRTDCYCLSADSIRMKLETNNFKMDETRYLHPFGETIYRFFPLPIIKVMENLFLYIFPEKGTKIFIKAIKQ